MGKPEGHEWVSTYVRKETKQKLRQEAASLGISVAKLVARLIERHVKETDNDL